MELQITWFVLWSVLWGVYFMLDGFVLGTGMLHPFLGRSETDKRVIINTVGPVWDGNEVWLITAGGATFAAFPTTYALMFSYLYTALLLLLFALIVRGVSFEFRGKVESAGWRRGWDAAIFVGSLVPALLFGVTFGNIFRGLPMNVTGYQGSFLSLLNPYALLTGLLFVLLFLMHGALYLSVKTQDELERLAIVSAQRIWIPATAVAVAFLGATWFATHLFDNYINNPLLFAVPVLAVVALLSVRFFLGAGKTLSAFTASCITILAVIATGVTGLYPNLIPSSLDPAASLTIFNSSSSPYTLKIMTVVAFIFVPIVIAYKIWVYRVFRARVTGKDIEGDSHAY